MSELITVIFIFLIGLVLGVGHQAGELNGFACTQQRAITDTMPQEYECTQWTKENEDGE